MSMGKPFRRLIAAASAALAIGIGSAAWAATSASAASAPAAVKACTAGQLSVWISPDALNGAAGTWYYPLEFTNHSGHACATGGYPGVSATDANGHQLGDAAARDPVYRGRVVVIPAG